MGRPTSICCSVPGHGDVWSAGDPARRRFAWGLGCSVRPTVKEMGPLADNWRPLRGVCRAFVVGALQSREKTGKGTYRSDTNLITTGLGEINLTPPLH